MQHIVIRPQGAATRRASALILHASDLAHALLAEQMARFGIVAPPRFMAGEDAADDQVDTDEDDREPAAEEKPQPWSECGTCGGSGGGEGYWRCPSCGGRGSVRNESWWADRDAAEADHAYDRWKDERAERGGA